MVTGTSARILSSLLLLLCLPADVFAFDGDPANAVFVDVHTGSDNNAGTMAQPLHTIGAGISTAATLSRKRVIVAKGDYPQSLTVSSGISLYGGYDQAAGWTHSAQNTTTIDGTVSFENAAGEAHFEGFTVLAADTDAGGSSYAVKIVDSAGPVYVQYNTLVSGPGVNGTSGVAGINGISGNNGNGGQNGLVDSNGGGGGGAGGAAGCGGGVGGMGGAGRYGTNNGLAGSNGTSNPNSGGTGGAAGNPGGSGSPGVAGANGTPGQSATFNSQLVGSVAAGAYVAPSISSATAGAASISSGGGGGGGGGQNGFFVQDGTGDGGGGGGGAGCGGSAGSSGQHGGGSFAVFVTNSMATVNANRLVIGSGGAGGAGKAGGTGGAGGAGGAGGSAGTGEVGAGGNGGKGGNGGSGGDGAGGNGGPAIGVFGTSAGIVTLGTNRFTRPNPALSGGAPTSNSANAGRVGLVQNAYPDNVDDPAAPTISIADVTIPKSITGTYRAMVRVSLGPIIDATVSVNYQTLDGTAMAGTDYLAASQTLVFDTWSASAFIPITILGHDSMPKTFTIVLTSPSGATLAKATATITIGYDADIIFRDGFD